MEAGASRCSMVRHREVARLRAVAASRERRFKTHGGIWQGAVLVRMDCACGQLYCQPVGQYTHGKMAVQRQNMSCKSDCEAGM
jgi:hypothetical protein